MAIIKSGENPVTSNTEEVLEKIRLIKESKSRNSKLSKSRKSGKK